MTGIPIDDNFAALGQKLQKSPYVPQKTGTTIHGWLTECYLSGWTYEQDSKRVFLRHKNGKEANADLMIIHMLAGTVPPPF